MHSAKTPLSKWAIAFYLYSTNLKGVSSMKLHRDLGIGQKAAWVMAHRIRGMWSVPEDKFAGAVEVKHLDRYSTEFEGRHNSRPLDTDGQMGMMVRGATEKRLRYQDLIA